MFISKKYVPIGNWNNMRPHIFNTILHIFIFEFNLSNLLCLTHFCHLKKKTTLFPPSPPEFTSSIFSTVTIHLQLLHIYFTMSTKIYKSGQTKDFGNYDWIHINFKHTRHNIQNDNKTFGISKRSNFAKPPKESGKN